MIRKIDFQADQANARYIAFLGTLKTAYSGAINTDPTSEEVKTQLRRDSLRLAADYRDKEVEAFTFILEDIAKDALRLLAQEQQLLVGVSELSEVATLYMTKLVDFYESEITSQLHRDIAVNMSNIENIGLEVFHRQQSGEDIRIAIAKTLLDRVETAPFYFRDRSGRRHPSQRYVRMSFRQTLLYGALQTYSIEASIRSANYMIVRHPENKASVEGTLLGFRRDQNLPLISDVKDEIFHPNSNAFVEAKFDAIQT